MVLWHGTYLSTGRTLLFTVQKFHCSVRRSVSEWLELHRRPHCAERDKDMAARVTVLSRFLPEPVKAQEFLTKFSVHLMRDPALLQGMETIVRPDISCKECADTTVGPLKCLYVELCKTD
jgi:sister-chromatid-cohesion protein PDS5